MSGLGLISNEAMVLGRSGIKWTGLRANPGMKTVHRPVERSDTAPVVKWA